jgi:protein-S-isoprenylcysteine O-methyltransferase Ste14
VTVQFGCLLYILVSAPVIAESYHGILIQASGLFLGLLAIYTMQIGNFNVTPLVLPDARIVKSGIYRIIRHPMYLSLLLVVLALLLDYYDWKRLLVATILILNLGVKISMEERELLKHFDEYKSYMSQTKRLIPFIY